MFTGIIEELGEITEARKGLLKVRVTKIRTGTKLGDSIAVCGVDLTVTRVTEKTLRFDVMPETYRRSALAQLRRGSRVNLERSIRAIDRLSGHLVRGVIEGIGTLKARREDGEAIIFTFLASRDLLANMVERGPVCVDGVSLTVIAKTATTFSVSVVKFTQENTTLLDRMIGESVNVETDIIMRYVRQALRTDNRMTARSRPPLS